MKIVPLRGLSINNVHAPQGVPVDVEDKLAGELIGLRVAIRAPEAPPAVVEEVPAPAAPVIETAAVPPAAATETAATRKRRK